MSLEGRTPTANEKKWMDIITDQVGCIVCRRMHGVVTPPEIHHLEGKTKPEAHFKTIPLCYRHHRADEWTKQFISYHGYSIQFERRYGSVWALWHNVVDLVGLNPLTGKAPFVKGGVLARRAGMMCLEPQFWLFLDRYRTYMYEVDIADGTHNHVDAREAIIHACKVRSRRLLDHDRIAQSMFLKIVSKYAQWKSAGWLDPERPDINAIRSRRHVPLQFATE